MATRDTHVQVCPHHDRCAFTGTEPGRCPRCHSTWEKITGCHCRDCGPAGDTDHHREHCGVDRDREIAKRAERAAAKVFHSPPQEFCGDPGCPCGLPDPPEGS